jgi:REP element-mobilizing transposase RayT
MNSHIHLVIETPDANVSAGMQYLCGRYAQSFNHAHGVTGHLFQGRFHSVRRAMTLPAMSGV